MNESDRWAGLEPGQRPFREGAWFLSEYRYRPSHEFARLLATHLGWSDDDRLLDLGAGPAHVSMLFAPYVREVVAMEPEVDMLDEGRRRAASAGIDTVSFVRGGSDDLPRLKSSRGEFAAVVISQAFHWMRDQDSVLRFSRRDARRKAWCGRSHRLGEQAGLQPSASGS
jgi:ubiquinone/menaquinone biosynthesis C-methylase UbiE